MRTLLFLALALFATPSLAADWGHYVNERFGVEIDVPPGFQPGEPPANGDGMRFSTPTAELAVFGSMMTEGDFTDEAAQRQQWATEDGWAITYQASTPGWATWSGKKGSRILYARAIEMCDGATAGVFELSYSVADLKAFDAVINRLVRSLKNSGDGWQC